MSNFPLRAAYDIIKKYNINNNYYDFSCGWGSRLLGGLKVGVNYYGTDPNYLLVDRLNDLASQYKECLEAFANNKPSNHTHLNELGKITDIRSVGSEVFISEWENMMGLAFSSPPYFMLEDYKVGNQSYKPGTSYESWKTGYLNYTIKNIYKYLISGGYFVINVKNFDKYDLVDDVKSIAYDNGFEYLESFTLKNISRCYGVVGESDVRFSKTSDEQVFVYQKI